MLSIGPHKLRNHVLLAPMAGVTDLPFRELAWRFGAGYVVGEMVSSRAELWDSDKSRLRRCFTRYTGPRAVQIAGGDPQAVAASARRHWLAGADIVDINFGCPAKKVCRKAAGSQLLRDPDLVEQIVRATVAAVDIPVTAKLRTGWCRANRNALDIACRLEAAGAAALVVHGRTRECRFLGAAEHDTVAKIKTRVAIPVFANGDIESLADAERVLHHTGCDGIMIGRAALGQPWLLGDIASGTARRFGLRERMQIVCEHVRALHDFYGERGIRIARKHVRWYLQHMQAQWSRQSQSGLPLTHVAGQFNRLEDANAQLDCLHEHALRMVA